MNRYYVVTVLALFAVLACMGLSAAAECPPTEGLHNCRTTEVVGAKPVCEGDPQYEAAAPESTPTQASPTATVPAPREAVPNAAARRFCYSAATWGPAPDAQRPCVRVATLYEDGSARLVQEDAAGSYRVVCTLQNPREVRKQGSYVTRCTRVR